MEPLRTVNDMGKCSHFNNSLEKLKKKEQQFSPKSAGDRAKRKKLQI